MNTSPDRYGHLTFNSPLSEARADAIVGRLAAAGPDTILDIGCGWAELLLRLAAAVPDAAATGVDVDAGLLQRARTAAGERDLSVTFEERPGNEVTEAADVVICVGSGHAFGESAKEALAGLRGLVRPGGRLLFGEGFWEERGRVDRELVWEDMRAMPDLSGVVDLARSAGFRPLWVETANNDEWEAFESGYLADLEEWLMANPDDEERRTSADDHRKRWLRGYRNGLGFTYLTLGLPG